MSLEKLAGGQGGNNIYTSDTDPKNISSNSVSEGDLSLNFTDFNRPELAAYDGGNWRVVKVGQDAPNVVDMASQGTGTRTKTVSVDKYNTSTTVRLTAGSGGDTTVSNKSIEDVVKVDDYWGNERDGTPTVSGGKRAQSRVIECGLDLSRYQKLTFIIKSPERSTKNKTLEVTGSPTEIKSIGEWKGDFTFGYGGGGVRIKDKSGDNIITVTGGSGGAGACYLQIGQYADGNGYVYSSVNGNSGGFASQSSKYYQENNPPNGAGSGPEKIRYNIENPKLINHNNVSIRSDATTDRNDTASIRAFI